MAKTYDVIIVGAGPGGAMAAKVAGENGLKTALLERKQNPGEITRTCAMMFAVESDYYFAERMFFNDKNGKMVFPVNGFTVDYDGPIRNFYAWHFHAPDGLSRIEFGNYEESIKKGNKGRLSFVYDKGRLIDGLIKDAVAGGVDLFTGVNVNGVEKTAQGIKVRGNREIFEGTFVIGADGLNSRVASLMGFNKERSFYGTSPKLTHYVSGLTLPHPEAINILTYARSDALFPVWICPSVGGDHLVDVRSPEQFDYLAKESVFSKYFRNITVNRKLSYVLSLRTPVSEPFKDNVLLVGDAAWFVEAEITGSMMCGWKAANAVTLALRDNRPDREGEGVLSYIDWWKKSYPEFEDYRNFALAMLFINGVLSEAEQNYLYRLIQQPMRATLNPFLVVGIIKETVEPMIPQIKKEMPSLIEKLRLLGTENVDMLLSEVKKRLSASQSQVTD